MNSFEFSDGKTILGGLFNNKEIKYQIYSVNLTEPLRWVSIYNSSNGMISDSKFIPLAQGGFIVHFSDSGINGYHYKIYDNDGNFVTTQTDAALALNGFGGFAVGTLIETKVYLSTYDRDGTLVLNKSKVVDKNYYLDSVALTPNTIKLPILRFLNYIESRNKISISFTH